MSKHGAIRRIFAILTGKAVTPEGPGERGATPLHPPAAEEREEPDRARDSEAQEDAPVVMPIEDSIDLHTFAPRDIASVVEEYLHEARLRGFREVRVIHGRGKGVQRRIVHGVLARHPAVDSFRDAPASRGGWGATLVWLRQRRDTGGQRP